MLRSFVYLAAFSVMVLLSACGRPVRKAQTVNIQNNESLFGVLSVSSATIDLGAQASFTVTAIVPSSLSGGSVYYRRLPNGNKVTMSPAGNSYVANFQTSYSALGPVTEQVEIGVDNGSGIPNLAVLSANLTVVAAGSSSGAQLAGGVNITFNPGNSVLKDSNLSARIAVAVDAGVAPLTIYVNGQVVGQLAQGERNTVVNTALPTAVVGNQNVVIRLRRSNGDIRDFSFPYTVNASCTLSFSLPIYQSSVFSNGQADYFQSTQTAVPPGYSYQGEQYKLSSAISCGCTPVLLARYKAVSFGSLVRHATMRAESAASLAPSGWSKEADLGYACESPASPASRQLVLYYNPSTWGYFAAPRNDAGMAAYGYVVNHAIGYVP